MEPDPFFIDEIHRFDDSVFNPLAEKAGAVVASRAYRTTIIRLERLVAAPMCGMTSRPGTYRRMNVVRYASGHPPAEVSIKFANYEVAQECRAWGRFLVEALSIGRKRPDGVDPLPLAQVAEHFVPAPQPRLFTAGCFPGVKAEKPGRWLKAKGGARVRRR